ncbi:DUF6461 domain-containing protein [Spirilliplanes yamanashiensis]|uniref:Uncharacterized protein n=1 Tax=Spirilliplanes yamanashiensis TaxID=42233 RepID=A0A8J3Y4S8_9ACTN|nr:DUF6461 domain-containing protein [Spirilliplanes yamanashiensis]MDP9819420.1 hypothetical protein [Spirilliplanes yamanashiensis]GIJ01756.1 hypothetical protein Sya03_11080 [Spirilliplanes yamanashiensis]
MDLAGATSLVNELDEICTLIFVRGVDEVEALGLIGAYPDTVAPRTGDDLRELIDDFDAGYPTMAAAVRIGDWTVLVQPNGFEAADDQLVRHISTGTEVLAVLRHDYASPRVTHAVDGVTRLSFDPGYPDVDLMDGAEVDAVLPLLREFGFRDPEQSGDEGQDDHTTSAARAILLAQRLTGVRLQAGLLEQPRLSAQFEPWFARPHGEPLLGDEYVPESVELAEAARSADAGTQRTVAVAEIRRMAAALGIDGTPGLPDVLDAAGRGIGVTITADSPLGTHIRAWLTAAQRAGMSLNDTPNQDALTDEERNLANAYGWFVHALGGVLDPDPGRAVLAALHPLGADIYGGPELRRATINALRSSP